MDVVSGSTASKLSSGYGMGMWNDNVEDEREASLHKMLIYDVIECDVNPFKNYMNQILILDFFWLYIRIN